jgi:hypothetical protein
MRVRRVAHSLLLLWLSMLAGPQGLTAQTAPANTIDTQTRPLQGRVVDTSAAVLPGVVVTAVSADNKTMRSVVTDGGGEFTLSGLTPGDVTLSFHLDGFTDAQMRVAVVAPGNGTNALIVQRLELAGLAEQVTVRGELPPEPPPPPPPPPVLVPVVPHDETSVCAPAKADAPIPSIGILKAGVYDPTKNLFAAGEEIVVDGGTLAGLRVGDNFVTRRRYATGLMASAKIPIMGEHSSGLVQIVSVEERVSSAVVVYTCDAVMTGDYLARFQPEPTRHPESSGRPAFELGARVLFGDAGHMVGVERRLVVIDRGSAQSMRPGQRVTLFRKSVTGQQTIVGQAVVVTVKADSATIRIDQARDAIFFAPNGDWAAPQRPPQMGQR